MMRTLKASEVHTAISKALCLNPVQEFLKPFDHDFFDYQLRCLDSLKSLKSDVNVGTDVSYAFNRIKNLSLASRSKPMVIYPKMGVGDAWCDQVMPQSFFVGEASAYNPIERRLLRTNENNKITITIPKERI